MAPSKKLKILFVTSELFPFVKTGGLADVSAALPQVLNEHHEVRIIVPKYGAIDTRKYKIHDVVRLKDLSISLGEKQITFSIRSSFLPVPKSKPQIYFVDSQEYFGSKKSLYSNPLTGQDHPDNDESFILFNRAVFELIVKLGWVPDIIHCNDWQASLVPIYKQTLYKEVSALAKVRVLLTVHNFATQGVFDTSSFVKTGLPANLNTEKGLVHEGKLNFLKAGIVYADAVNTVSEGHAKETLHDKEFSYGMSKFLNRRKESYFGMVNGIDSNVWNPEKDSFIKHKYTVKTLEKKYENKRDLLERFNLSYDESTPLVGIISRLTDSKGIDIIAEALPRLLERNVQIVLLGTGDRKYHVVFDKIQKEFPKKFKAFLGFNDELAHLIEAGSDIYLMPSKTEPCGLNQMYSLIYGTVPLVRETGGLADTISRFNSKTGEGSGFMFKEYSAEAFIKEFDRALKYYSQKDVWKSIQKRGMGMDFSWNATTKRYIDLYKTILSAQG